MNYSHGSSGRKVADRGQHVASHPIQFGSHEHGSHFVFYQKLEAVPTGHHVALVVFLHVLVVSVLYTIGIIFLSPKMITNMPLPRRQTNKYENLCPQDNPGEPTMAVGGGQ